jgi:hypothetical protein
VTKKLLWMAVVLVSAGVTAAQAQVQLGETQQTPWRGLAISMAAHGAASGFDAWTSWNRPERNVLLADGGRFAAGSAYTKAGIFAGASLVEVLVVKKWGKTHPWVARACQIANFTSAGMLVSAGVSNLRRQ